MTMDPNEVLARIREIIKDGNYQPDTGEGYDNEVAVDELSELVGKVQELDEWLSRGGFLPSDWQFLPGDAGRRQKLEPLSRT